MTAPPDTPSDPTALAVLGHELRTPLAAIIGFADAMRERAFGPLGDQYVECADTIHQGAQHMLALVDRMTRTGPGDDDRKLEQFHRFDARTAVTEVKQLLRARADALGVELAATLPAAPLTVAADAMAVKQIAVNLVANALAVTPHGGRVSITLEAQGADLVLTVQDTGPGLARPHSEGLGLTLVRALCADHGGEFILTKDTTIGARAVARLPVIAET